MSDRGMVQVRVTKTVASTAVIKAFREATDLTLAEIREALVRMIPITAAELYGRDHDETRRRLQELLDTLDHLETEYELLIDGEPESRDYLNNILQRWNEIGIETGMMTDLEIGEPNIDTLQWLQRQAPVEIFRDTLEQIVQGGQYNVDSETLDWVKHHLRET